MMTGTKTVNSNRISREGSFNSQGIACAYTLHKPIQSQTQRFPAILMMHGWGGTQPSWVSPFIDQFVNAGFAVMTFDFRTWGKSGGSPRHVIKISDRLIDAENALGCIKSQPEVDAKKIILWGTSLGGGHACNLAVKHPELVGVIAQVPMLDGRAAAKRTPFKQKVHLAAYVLADLVNPFKTVYVPIYANPGEFGTMTRDDASKLRDASERLYGKGTDNYIAARSVLTMGPYRPLDVLADIKVPMLMLGGKADTVAPFPAEAVRLINDPKIEVIELAANHFQPYMQPVFEENIKHQLQFLEDLLAIERASQSNPS